MADDRLTKQELGWLLAQEARSAAAALRQGVTKLKQPGSAPRIKEGGSEPPVETSLDALEDAIGMLSLLESHKPGTGRRGRIDVAALLYQLAPNARIAMEPGAGTEVFGTEEDLSRMLHVLVSLTGDPGAPSASASPEVRIRRDADLVRISVDLGPDRSATAEVERRWLVRMAMRLGGRVELEGGTQSLVLPADAAAEQREVASLRRELEQAQQLGETYARELAEILSTGAEPAPESDRRAEPSPTSQRFEMLVRSVTVLERALRSLLSGLRADCALAAELLGEESPLHVQLAQRIATVFDLSAELRPVAECPVHELPATIRLEEVTREALNAVGGRAARRNIEIVTDVPPSLVLETPPGGYALLLRALLTHAVAATPSGGQVTVRAVPAEAGARVEVTDGGPSVPDSQQLDLLKHRVDPASLGRPGGIAVLTADAAAEHLGLRLVLDQDEGGRARFCVETRAASSSMGDRTQIG